MKYLATFGKKEMEQGIIPQGYRWVQGRENLSDSLAEQLKQYCHQFQWTGIDDKVYDPFVRIVRIEEEEAAYEMWYFDNEKDDKGRPHCLKVDIYRLDNENEEELAYTTYANKKCYRFTGSEVVTFVDEIVVESVPVKQTPTNYNKPKPYPYKPKPTLTMWEKIIGWFRVR